MTTPLASMRGIPHPHGLGFLLHSQNQRPDSAGLTSHLSDGTILQIQKPVTDNSLTNKMKNIKRDKGGLREYSKTNHNLDNHISLLSGFLVACYSNVKFRLIIFYRLLSVDLKSRMLGQL